MFVVGVSDGGGVLSVVGVSDGEGSTDVPEGVGTAKLSTSGQ